MYKITELVFNEKQGILVLKIQDERGNIIDPLNVENRGLSGSNESTLIDLPEINENTLDFSGQSKTQKTVRKKKSNLEVLTEFCSKKKTEEGINLKSLTRFFNYYKNVFETKGWNGAFYADKRWDSWLEKER